MFSKKYKRGGVKYGGGAGGQIYGMGVVGAMVFYIQQADGFWPVVWAIIKAFVWPAFVVYDLLKHIV
ncbi:hypothetical protein A3F05_00730 [Candidatus Saccharibacteria bacterium RIFCSPHIGHO2_12_FULL_47_17]|nr:MAG: hypothetical protein A3F05_00730 [Candidatus Saccharibacteria bacterium RIFCSPHIGHO2_12_FULL_47_17]